MKWLDSLLSLLLVLATPAAVSAETTIYFLRHAVEVPASVQLLVAGLALSGLGGLIRRWRTRARPQEPQRSDKLPLGPISPPVIVVGSPVSDAAQRVPGGSDPSHP